MSVSLARDISHRSSRSDPKAVGSPLEISPDLKARIRILVVDDEHTLRESCASMLRHEGYDVVTCGRGQEALDLVKHKAFDIVLVDLNLPQVDGLTVLRATLATHRDTVVIMMTGNPTVDSNLEALRQGAFDYLPKPFAATHLQILIGRAVHSLLAHRESREDEVVLERLHGASDKIALLGTAPAFRRAIEIARRVAGTDASVFITGESGSGKEMIAQYIHQHSRRASQPFIAINCAALPEGLLESEMFGHRRGAFTGAVRDKPGLLEAANGGTLFLDELVEMPKAIQAKLLRVLQDGVVRRVGSETTDAVVDVRFIAATNREPEAAVRAGDMREDLYYRLRVVPIQIPALRDRPEDIPLLADHFLRTFWERHRGRNAPPPTLSERALQVLCAHPWHGNVRELQNAIEHVAVMVDAGVSIQPDNLELDYAVTAELMGGSTGGAGLATAGAHSASAPGTTPASLVAAMVDESYHAARERVITQFERSYVTWLVNRVAGNMSKAARVAGVDRTTLYRMMERHGLQRSPVAGWVVEREAGLEPVALVDADPATAGS